MLPGMADPILDLVVTRLQAQADPERAPAMAAYMKTAILAQLKMGERTDAERLFRYCRARMHETEFFVRKAIGWALRQYAKADPEAVRAFAEAEKGNLSGLSYREATKHI